jgi:hypothetical protein
VKMVAFLRRPVKNVLPAGTRMKVFALGGAWF